MCVIRRLQHWATLEQQSPQPERALSTWKGDRRIGLTRLMIALSGELGGGAGLILITFL